ncbi:hypothetical protein MEME101129_22330 [Methylobacterium mesophilicum]
MIPIYQLSQKAEKLLMLRTMGRFEQKRSDLDARHRTAGRAVRFMHDEHVRQPFTAAE